MLAIIPLYVLCIIAITNPNNSFPHRISRWRKNWILPGAAGGWGAVKSVANAVRKQMDIRQMLLPCLTWISQRALTVRVVHGQILSTVRHSTFVKTAQKQSPREVTDKQVNASFFAENTVQSLLTREITSLRLRDVSLSLWNMMPSATVTSH